MDSLIYVVEILIVKFFLLAEPGTIITFSFEH